MTPQDLVLIIGMHRSGTSFVSQALSVMGLDLGRTLMLPSFDNPRGFWENQAIVDVNAKLLDAHGKDWTTAGFLPADWMAGDAADRAADELLELLETDFTGTAPRLVKDPRNCVLKPLWDRVASKGDYRIHPVWVLRSPSGVAASIARRNSISETTALAIYASYLDAASDWMTGEADAPVLVYEQLVAGDGETLLVELRRTLPLEGTARTSALVGQLDRVIGKPRHASRAVPDIADMSPLDRADAAYDVLRDAVSPTTSHLREFRDAFLAIPGVRDALETLSEARTALPPEPEAVTIPARQLDALKTDLDRAQTERAALEGGIAERDADIRKLLARIETLEEERAAFKDGVSERETLLADLRDHLQIVEKERAAFEGGVAERENILVELRERLELVETERAAFKDGVEEREAALAKLRTSLAQSETDAAAFRDGVAERENILAELRDRLETVETERAAFEDGVAERDATIVELRSRLDESETQRAAFEGGVAERNKELANLRRSLTRAKTDKAALKGGVAERDEIISELRSRLDESETQRAAFEGGVAERDGTIAELRQSLDETQAVRDSLQGGILERDQLIADERRMREVQDTVAKVEQHKTRLIEAQNREQIEALQRHLEYYRRMPIRAAAKSTVFQCLRFLRRALPLPGSTKAKIAHSLTGLAQRLQPPLPVAPVAPVPVTADASDIDFGFAETDAPVISIIVPVYDQIGQTIACLRSIWQQVVDVPYEVILADDASPSPIAPLLDQIVGLRYFRNAENQHFLRNCNLNAAHARGDYLLFLNNDTLVKPGWLQSLYDTYREHGNVGIVGSKLIFPDGTLQEAGGIIWEDGSGWNWGRGQDPQHPLYNFVRDVDYVSGASLMVMRELWDRVGGFSEDLEKAYYEDTDLCFRARSLGYRVLYQPASEVIHIEGLSSGTDLNAGAKQYQLVNQKTFMETWADTLSRHLPNATTPMLASDRSRKGHVLYLDAVTPEPQNDSGSLDAVYAMRILSDLGYRVHFVPGSNFAHWGRATADLQQMGVECVYHPFYSDLGSFLKERGDMFDFAVVSRPESAARHLAEVRTYCPSADIIYNTVDLHFLRLNRKALVLDDAEIAQEAERMREEELGYIAQSDATIVLSHVERGMLVEEGVPEDKLWTIPLIRAESRRLVEFETSRDVVVIGGYRHPPNVDAVDWLVRDIWPTMREVIPDAKLHICGSNMPERFADYAADDILIRGFVADLDGLLSQTRLTIAPLRFGAGLKGKVASSIGAGVPCLGTPVAFEGMSEDGLDAVKLEAETPEGFAALAARVYDNEAVWTAISHAGVAYHNANYAYGEVAKTYALMLDTLAGTDTQDGQLSPLDNPADEMATRVPAP